MKRSFIFLSFTVFFISLLIVGNTANTNAQNQTGNDSKDNVSPPGLATMMYEQKKTIVDPSIKKFVILIPNEGHESINQAKNQWPLANAPYIPQNLEISKGTAVTWFNGDVDHDHIIKFQSPNNGNIPNTETFPFLGHATVTFNDVGQYQYFEDGDLNDDKSFKMKGTVDVVDSTPGNSSLGNAVNSTQSGDRTLGVLMVPSKDASSISNDLAGKGITTVDSTTFTDIRGGQKGTGPTQTFIVWDSEQGLENALSTIVDISKGLPYS